MIDVFGNEGIHVQLEQSHHIFRQKPLTFSSILEEVLVNFGHLSIFHSFVWEFSRGFATTAESEP